MHEDNFRILTNVIYQALIANFVVNALRALFTEKGSMRVEHLFQFAIGVIFSFGLGMSGMLKPSAVHAFLTIGKDWSPALGCVMAGALALNFITFPLMMRISRKSLFSEEKIQNPQGKVTL